jgi:Family of unknown function (DUF6011)
MSRYKWVRQDDGTKLYSVGILADGSLHNPNGYPNDVVRAAVLAADARRHERRSKAAKAAVETRRERKTKRVDIIARHYKTGGKIGPRKRCYICARHLSDLESINRGIGPECWQDFLTYCARLG